MILIADSGSTKTDWTVTDNGKTIQRLSGQGINPFMQTADNIRDIISEELINRLNNADIITEVYFYGAGCRKEKHILTNIFQELLKNVNNIDVETDLTAAARALFGQSEGIACILGTGSNSGYYNGKEITQNISPLGYILGDEGSGADLGKHFLHDLLKGQLPEQLRDEFYSSCQLSYPQVIQRIYQQPRANSFLASLAPLIHRHLDNQHVYDMVLERFRSFVRYNLKPYRRPDLPVSFVGSVAYYFRDLLAEAIEREGLKMGTVARTPMAGLLAYHGVDAADV